VEYLLKQRQTTPVEFHKYFDEALSRKPFALITTYVVLENSGYLSVPEVRTFTDKAALDISEFEYIHFRYSPLHTLLRQRIQQFETIGD
jgi:hypothetical protein